MCTACPVCPTVQVQARSHLHADQAVRPLLEAWQQSACWHLSAYFGLCSHRTALQGLPWCLSWLLVLMLLLMLQNDAGAMACDTAPRRLHEMSAEGTPSGQELMH